MQKWEYLTALVGASGSDNPCIQSIMGQDLPKWAKFGIRRGLNVLGEDGWELVGIHWPSIAAADSGTNDPTYIFKRPAGAGLPPVDQNTYGGKWASLK